MKSLNIEYIPRQTSFDHEAEYRGIDISSASPRIRKEEEKISTPFCQQKTNVVTSQSEPKQKADAVKRAIQFDASDYVYISSDDDDVFDTDIPKSINSELENCLNTIRGKASEKSIRKPASEKSDCTHTLTLPLVIRIFFMNGSRHAATHVNILFRFTRVCLVSVEQCLGNSMIML